MAGEKSKYLVNRIRDILGDLHNKRIRNDVILYDLLTRYQREFMTSYNTTRTVTTVTLTTATEYTLATNINKIIRVYVPDTQTDTDYYITIDEINRKIKIGESETPVTGEKIYIDAYLKPVTAISKTVDPVIGDDYEPYLTDAVLTHFPTEGIPQTLADIEEVRERVRDFASRQRVMNRFTGGKTIQSLNFY